MFTLLHFVPFKHHQNNKVPPSIVRNENASLCIYIRTVSSPLNVKRIVISQTLLPSQDIRCLCCFSSCCQLSMLNVQYYLLTFFGQQDL